MERLFPLLSDVSVCQVEDLDHLNIIHVTGTKGKVSRIDTQATCLRCVVHFKGPVSNSLAIQVTYRCIYI